jgi:hypothetical protein
MRSDRIDPTGRRAAKRKHFMDVLNCDWCKPHRRDNATRIPLPDRYKDERKGR